MIDFCWRRNDTELCATLNARFECRETLGFALLDRFGRARVGIYADAVARRSSKHFIDWDPEGFALDVPQRLFDPTEHARQDWPAAIKGVAIDRLPVMHDRPWVLADEIGRHLLHGRRTGLRPPLRDWFA